METELPLTENPLHHRNHAGGVSEAYLRSKEIAKQRAERIDSSYHFK